MRLTEEDVFQMLENGEDDFSGMDLSGLDLHRANLEQANLEEANLKGANLRGAILRGAILSNANLSNANLSRANIEMADLDSTNLQQANLDKANLSSSWLYGANLTGADLSGAWLETTNLSRTNLIGANLSGADLPKANLEGANLIGANLEGADLEGADLTGVKSDSSTKWPEGFNPRHLDLKESRLRINQLKKIIKEEISKTILKEESVGDQVRYYNIELGYFSDMFIEDIDSKVIDEVEDSWYIEEREGYTWAETETDPPSTDYHFEGFNKGERFFDLKWDFLLDEYRDMFSTMDELRAEIENSLRFMDDVSIYTNISSESGEFTAHVYSYPKTSITEIDGGFRVEMKFKFSDDGVEGI